MPSKLGNKRCGNTLEHLDLKTDAKCSSLLLSPDIRVAKKEIVANAPMVAVN